MGSVWTSAEAHWAEVDGDAPAQFQKVPYWRCAPGRAFLPLPVYPTGYGILALSIQNKTAKGLIHESYHLQEACAERQ